MPTILILDDHEVTRRGIRTLLESMSGWTVVAEASNGREAIELAEKHKPDVAVMDITVPVLSGLEAARRIRSAAQNTEIVFLTVHNSEQMLHEALAAGARGYLLKADGGKDLLSAVKAVKQHKTFISAKFRGSPGPGSSGLTTTPTLASLTPREREVLHLLAEGNSTKQAANLLGIAVKTAETHRTNILRKLELHSISELVLYAIRNKIVEA